MHNLKNMFVGAAMALGVVQTAAAQTGPARQAKPKAPTVEGIYPTDGAVFHQAQYVVDTTGHAPTMIEATFYDKHIGGGPKVFAVNTLRGIDANGDGKLQWREVTKADFSTNYRTENAVLKNKRMTNLISSSHGDAGYGEKEAISYMIDHAKVTSLITVDNYGAVYQDFSQENNNLTTEVEEVLDETPLAVADATARSENQAELAKELAAIRANAALDEIAQAAAEMDLRVEKARQIDAKVAALQAADHTPVMNSVVVQKHFVHN